MKKTFSFAPESVYEPHEGDLLGLLDPDGKVIENTELYIDAVRSGKIYARMLFHPYEDVIIPDITDTNYKYLCNTHKEVK